MSVFHVKRWWRWLRHQVGGLGLKAWITVVVVIAVVQFIWRND